MKRLKFGNKITEVDGIKFRSKKEANRYGELKWLERGGEIKDFRIQPRFELTINETKVGTYTADFGYREASNKFYIVEDVKGYFTSEQKFRVRVFRALYPEIDFRIIK